MKESKIERMAQLITSDHVQEALLVAFTTAGMEVIVTTDNPEKIELGASVLALLVDHLRGEDGTFSQPHLQ